MRIVYEYRYEKVDLYGDGGGTVDGLWQRQCIAEATAKEQQCLVDYFAQLRPKRWQEWERRYSGLSTAQYIFLIMQDDLRYDDEAIAAALNVKRTSVRSIRSRIKGREREVRTQSELPFHHYLTCSFKDHYFNGIWV